MLNLIKDTILITIRFFTKDCGLVLYSTNFYLFSIENYPFLQKIVVK